MNKYMRLCWLLSSLLLGCVQSLLAMEVRVNPVSIILTKDHPISSLKVTNVGKTPAVMCIEVMRWQQKSGQSTYTPSRDLIVAPPMLSIPSQQTQLLRVGIRPGAIPSGKESAYRVYLTEVPTSKAKPDAIRMLLRIGVPIFVRPHAAINKNISWKVIRHSQAVQVVAENTGNVHYIVQKFVLDSVAENSTHLITQSVNDVILPAQTRVWTFTKPHILDNQLKLTVSAANGTSYSKTYTIGAH